MSVHVHRGYAADPDMLWADAWVGKGRSLVAVVVSVGLRQWTGIASLIATSAMLLSDLCTIRAAEDALTIRSLVRATLSFYIDYRQS